MQISFEKFLLFLPKAYIKAYKHLNNNKIDYVDLPLKPT